MGRLSGNVESAKPNRATIRLVEAGEQVEKGRLPGAIWPDDADDLAGIDREIDLVRGGHSAEALHQSIHVEQWLVRGNRQVVLGDLEIGDESAAARLNHLLVDRQRARRAARRNDSLATVQHHQDEDNPEDKLV